MNDLLEVVFLAVCLVAMYFSNMGGLITVYDDVKELKDTCARIELAQEVEKKELEKVRKVTQANTDVCNLIISGEW